MTRGARLRLLRAALDLSQSALAERAGYQHTTVNHFESNRRRSRPNTVSDLAQALGVDPQALEDDDVCFRELARLLDYDLERLRRGSAPGADPSSGRSEPAEGVSKPHDAGLEERLRRIEAELQELRRGK